MTNKIKNLWPGLVIGALVEMMDEGFADDAKYFGTKLRAGSRGIVRGPVDNDFHDSGDGESGPMLSGGYFVLVEWEEDVDPYFGHPEMCGNEPYPSARYQEVDPYDLRVISCGGMMTDILGLGVLGYEAFETSYLWSHPLVRTVGTYTAEEATELVRPAATDYGMDPYPVAYVGDALKWLGFPLVMMGLRDNYYHREGLDDESDVLIALGILSQKIVEVI